MKKLRALAAATALFGSLGNSAIALADGPLDFTFGVWGTTYYFNNISFPYAITNDAQGRLLVLTQRDGGPAVTRHEPNGHLDESFGTDGIANDYRGTGDTYVWAKAIAVDHHDRIVVGGGYQVTASCPDGSTPTVSGFLTLRLLDNGGLDGQLDHDFRGSGTSSFSGGCHQPLDDITGLAIGRDDSVFGIGSLQGPYKAVVAKWNSDGQIDTSFGDSGSITYALPAAWGTAGVSIAIDADNRLLAALRTDGSSGIGGAIVRFTPNGQLDSSFGTDGVVDLGTLGYGSLAGLCCIQVDSSDRILVTGIQETRPDTSGFLDQHAFAARFTNDGTPDETFGTHGFALVGNGWFFSIAALAIDEHNRPFIAGTFASPYNPDFGVGVIQLNDDGSPNTAVGFGGIFSAEFGRNHATALSVGADGRIVLASYNEVSSSALLRYDQIFGDGVD